MTDKRSDPNIVKSVKYVVVGGLICTCAVTGYTCPIAVLPIRKNMDNNIMWRTIFINNVV
ncbi:MAG: hypothetical protein K9J37_07910 [Saprospiraceae bacterium]|nr:hypothetical protein [Saprospiraceae bacterium]MCF8311743.1 hypothetical protein [Saprospiraceae bacterium]